jgi:hypothetical protein
MTPLPVNMLKSGGGAGVAVAFVIAVLAAVAIMKAGNGSTPAAPQR